MSEPRTYPCCEHCADDQPHIEPDTHDLPCDLAGCQVWIYADAVAEIRRLQAEVHRLNAELAVSRALEAT